MEKIISISRYYCSLGTGLPVPPMAPVSAALSLCFQVYWENLFSSLLSSFFQPTLISNFHDDGGLLGEQSLPDPQIPQ